MKAKKTILGAAFFSLFVLSACQNGIPDIKKTDYFKEYTFEARATSEQIKAIQDGIKDGVNTLSWVSVKSEAYTKSKLSESFDTIDAKARILEDASNRSLLIMESTGSTNKQSKSGGITMKQSTSNEEIRFDGGKGTVYTISRDTVNGSLEEKTVTSSVPSGKNSKTYKDDAISQLLGTSDNIDYAACYANKDGSFTCVGSSSVTKTVTAVEWGASTKELIKESKTQSVLFVDKDYRVTSYYHYSEQSSNRDGNTGEWYDSVQITSYDYYSLVCHYGTRASASVSELTMRANSYSSKQSQSRKS